MTVTVTLPEDLLVLDNGLVYDDRGRLSYMWFETLEREGGREFHQYRVTTLRILEQIPLDARADAGIVAKTRTVLRGIWSTGLEIVYIVAGIFHPDPIGIVQLYGVTAWGNTLGDTANRSRNGMSSLEAALAAAFPQIRLAPVPMRIAQWLSEALLDMKHVLVTVGHPDPRESARGMTTDLQPSWNTHRMDRFTLQQNEIVMRGMAQLKEDFVLVHILHPVSMEDAARMLAGLAEYTSTWASWQTGTRSFTLGTSIPLIFTGSASAGTEQKFGETRGQAHTVGESDTTSQSVTQGQAHTETTGGAHTIGRAESTSWSTSVSRTVGQATTTSQSHTTSVAHTQGSSRGTSTSTTSGWSVGGGVSAGVPGVIGGSVTGSVSGSTTTATSQTSFSSTTTGESQTTGTAQTTSSSTTVTHTFGRAVTNSESWTDSWAKSDTTSRAETTGQAHTASQSQTQSQSQSAARGFNRSFAQGLAMGVAPSVAIGDANQWQFDPAILVTQILRKQQDILNQVTLEGGFYVDVYALTRTERGRKALQSLIPEAFHGTEDVVTGVQVRPLEDEREREYIRLHAKALTPSTRLLQIPELATAYADSTLLTPLQAAAYFAPGMFEEGYARTVQERIPPFAFDPDMPGVVVGHQWSTERAQLTSVPFRISRERHFHTAFVGDTGMGKTTAAERLMCESTKAWKMRTVILDFGQGWRKALNWPGMRGRVDIRQLNPYAVRPLRWNFLQVPKRMDPYTYRTRVAELFANAGRMGPRQLGFMREALTRVYKAHGVLVDESSGRWNRVRNDEEEHAINQARRERGLEPRPLKGKSLDDLEPFERQALAVYRSQFADVAEWLEHLRMFMEVAERKRDMASVQSLQGVLLRLEPLAEGEARRIYGPGTDTIPIEDLGLLGPEDDRWGVVVIEGGAEMDEFSKAALLSLLATVLYYDAVVRRREALSRRGPRLPWVQIVFEEANKVLSGVSLTSVGNEEGGNLTSQLFLNMWRDGRKYQIYLHLLAQTVSELPDGILSSCANLFVSQTKNPKDRDAIMAALARNMKGFVNAEYDRFIGRMPKGMAIVKLGVSFDMKDIEPYLVRPLLLDVREPSDEEIRAFFQAQPTTANGRPRTANGQ